MKDEDQRLGEGVRLIFDGDANPQWANAALSLLAAVRRGDAEMALRQQAAHIQNRLTGRVVDDDCRRVVELAQQVANDA